VSRLLSYKNIDVVIDAIDNGRRLVVVGDGPEAERLKVQSDDRVVFLRRKSDAELRWLFANCAALISSSYEDFGLTTIEAAGFGVPTIALRYGGFLDTVVEHETGELFDTPDAAAIRGAIGRFEGSIWDRKAIAAHAASFSANAFKARLQAIVAEEARLA
jgi:glycosyltransferase involved in cell wall biosynthesis